MIKGSWRLRMMGEEARAAIASTRSLRAAAKKIGVAHTTLSRAVKEGRLPAPGGPQRKPTLTAGAPLPDSWRAAVEARYNLSATERELVLLGQQALEIANDRDVSPAVRLQASGRFAGLVKDLALPTTEEDEKPHGYAEARRYPRPV